MVRPQFTERVVGHDRKPYLVSTIRFQKREFDEIWETAVFEGTGCLTPGRLQRYSAWSFNPEVAQQTHLGAIYNVRTQPTGTWVMTERSIAEERKLAFEAFNKPPSELFPTFPDEYVEEIATDDSQPEPMPQRSFGELEAVAFDGPNGHVNPGDTVRVEIPRGEDEVHLPRELRGRYLGMQLIDKRMHLVLEIAQDESGGSYRAPIPIEHGDRLTKVNPTEPTASA